MDAGNASQQISVHKRAHEIRTLRKRSAQVLYRGAEAPRVSAQPIARDSETGRHWGSVREEQTKVWVRGLFAIAERPSIA
jgi:hypothetical protein